MDFENYYYRITDCTVTEGEGTFGIEYMPQCKVFEGHFPGDAVCPGAMNIEIVKECTGKILGTSELHITEIKQCRFVELMRPQEQERTILHIDIEKEKDTYKVTASIKESNRDCMIFKGRMTV